MWSVIGYIKFIQEWIVHYSFSALLFVFKSFCYRYIMNHLLSYLRQQLFTYNINIKKSFKWYQLQVDCCFSNTVIIIRPYQTHIVILKLPDVTVFVSNFCIIFFIAVFLDFYIFIISLKFKCSLQFHKLLVTCEVSLWLLLVIYWKR